MARLCLTAEKFAFELGVKKNSSLLLAVSGGADSIALAVVFFILAKRQAFKLRAIHVNHSLRANANGDEAFVRGFCAALGVPLDTARVDVGKMARQTSRGLEETGRDCRHDIFAKTLARSGCDYVLLAHHADDLSEDVFMRLTRGAGWPALGGMGAVEGKLLRPLLRENPHNLKNLLRELKLTWREDESNADTRFKRNRFRRLILPALRAENPRLDERILDLHSLAQADRVFWQEYLDEKLRKNPWLESENESAYELYLPENLFRALPEAALSRLIARAIKRTREKTGKGSASAEAIGNLTRLLSTAGEEKIIQFAGGVNARVKNGAALFRVEKNTA